MKTQSDGEHLTMYAFLLLETTNNNKSLYQVTDTPTSAMPSSSYVTS